jgi:hypothetical protein
MKLYNPFSDGAPFVVQATVSWGVALCLIYGLVQLVLYNPVLVVSIFAGALVGGLGIRVVFYIFKGK